MEIESTQPDINYLFDSIRTNCEILQATLLLEYHDMNYLNGSPTTINKKQRDLVQGILNDITDIKIRTIGIK